jgi:hypothetical protein
MQQNTTQPTPSASQLIRAAIAAAGRGPQVAASLQISVSAVNNWIQTGRVPTEKIMPLCELGAFTIQPDQILSAIAREAKKAA